MTGGPNWLPVFVPALVFLAPFFVLYQRAQTHDSGLRFYSLLSIFLVVFLLFMLPDLIQFLANAPKIHEMIHARGGLQRA
jgi:hypothetical protein